MKNLLVSLLLLSATSVLSALEIGSALPAVDIPSRGELILDGDALNYHAWSTEAINRGAPALIFHMAARLSSESIIDPLRQRLAAADYPDGSFQSISIVNLDDALWGTTGLVLSKLGDNKRQHPRASLIADDAGRALAAWSLEEKNVAVILLDASGRIRYLHQGKLPDQEVEKIISLLNEEIAATEA